MSAPNPLTNAELHLHLAGSFHPEDFMALARPFYHEINWHGRDFVTEYNRVLQSDLDPVALFAMANGDQEVALARLRHYYVYDQGDNGRFDRFMWKCRFFQRVWAHGWDQDDELAQHMVQRLLRHHRQQGLDYVEYRSSFWGDARQQQRNLARLSAQLKEAAAIGLTARLIVPLPRTNPLPDFEMLLHLLAHTPELRETIVGIDFASEEEGHPPQEKRPFFSRLRQYNQAHPERALDAVYHVGETFYDKSLESAARWCHEAAELGAQRLGHCIALGLDPEIAVTRRPHAHETEPVSERLDQIAYDLRWQRELMAYGIAVNAAQLREEQTALRKLNGDEGVERPYSPPRFHDIRRRQQFVLDQFTRLGTVIECCPTSNLRIGGVPDAAHHPIHRFLDSRVNLAICTDDPGVFDITLASEIDWVLRHTGHTPATLTRRLGNPYRFRLGQSKQVS